MKNAKYSAQDIASFYVDLANREFVDDGLPEGITNLKLQKILYFAQAANLAVNDAPLFEEEFEAWKFGPVVSLIYNKYKSFGNQPITSTEPTNPLDVETKAFLENIWNIFGKYSAAELVNITHNHSPWKEAYYSGKGDNVVIEKSVLAEYYKKFFSSEDEGHEK